MRVGGQRHSLAALLLVKGPCTLYLGGWLGPRAGLHDSGNTRP
jgi:hypothetical protein